MDQGNNENTTHRELKERIKELNCLYELSRLMENRNISKNEFLQSAVNLIPPAWQYPGITCARLTYNEKEFKTEGFKETPWKQSADIVINNIIEGRIEVFYLEEKPQMDEGPFLKEERRILESFVGNLGQYLERKEKEEDLRKNKTILTKTQELAHIGNWELDLVANHLSWSDEVYRIFGLKPQEFSATYEAFLEYVHPDDRAKVDEAYTSSLEEGRDTYEVEHRVVRKHNGEIRHVYEKCYHERNREGKVIRSVGIVQDITEQKEIEAALRSSRENLRITINSIGDAVIATDTKGRITRMNPVAEKLTGWLSTEAEAQSLEKVFSIFNAKSGKKVENPVKEVLNTGKVVGLANDTKLISKNGDEYLIADSGSPIKNERGEIIGVVLVFRDVTKDYQLREKLKQNEYRFRQLFQNMSSSVVVYKAVNNGRDFEIVDFNAAAEQAEKINKGDVLGKKVTEVFPTVKDFGLFDVFKRVWETGKAEHHPTSKYKDDRIVGWRNNYVYKLPSGEIVALYDDVTQRKQAEERLRESKRQLATLMGNLPGMAYRCRKDKNWTMVFVSSGCLSLTGYYDKQLTYNTEISFSDLIHPDDRDMIWKEVQQAIQNNQYFLIEYRIYDKDKNLKWVWEQGSKMDKDSDGTDILEGFIMDITERKEAEEKTRKSEEKFRDIFNHTGDAIVIQNMQGDFREINDIACEKLGYTRDELMKKYLTDIEDPDKAEPIEERVYFIVQNGELTFETAVIRKDGTKLPVEVNVRYIEYEGKDALISVVRDISERKKSEKVKELLYNVSQLSIRDTGLKEYIAEIHNELKEIMKADNFYIVLYDEQIDKYTIPYFADEYDDLATDEAVSLKNTLTDYIRKTGQAKLITEEAERKLKKKEGIRLVGTPSPVWIGAPIYNSSTSEVTGVIALQDYKDKNAYGQDDLNTLNIIATNIGIFIERLKNLEDLKNAKEKAEESDRLKSAFLANMSHEIRTPMNGIMGFTTLLMETGLSSEEKDRYAEIIQKSGSRLMNTVNDLIEISKLESGVVTVDREKINANKLLEELVDFFRSEAREKGLSLSFDRLLPEKVSILYTDRSKLESILTNLIKNAIKYTDSGSVNVGCQVKDGFAEFYVKDTGIGVPENRREAIFKRFEQADVSDTRAFEGSGLGLAISKSYVEMLGGELGLESEENKGATFYFTLPLTKAKDRSPQLTTSPESTESDIPAEHEETGRKLTILVAEDDEDSFLYLKTLLRKMDCEIIQTITGTETVEKCRNNPDIDLILMDIKLPEMDGYEATQKIREFNQKVPIIAQTAYAMADDRQKALDAGCDDYIAKPIKKDDLKEKIRKLV